MKAITLEQLSQETDQLLQTAQSERLVITRNGEPVAVLVGIHHNDAEDIDLQLSPEFWRMIEERRAGPTVSMAEAESMLEE